MQVPCHIWTTYWGLENLHGCVMRENKCASLTESFSKKKKSPDAVQWKVFKDLYLCDTFNEVSYEPVTHLNNAGLAEKYPLFAYLCSGWFQVHDVL